MRKKKETRERKPPETYFEAAFAWRLARLVPGKQLRYYPHVGTIRRRWIEVDWFGDERELE